ncbi:uncharacterized protein LOC118732541, partial [Rhagoletis pomonella]|uniref:uncharacterized protein LOC118732541 n=1 Tax=Rhagoletis pomonella TaxID=28610 RepID=UPI001780C732
MKDAEQKFHSRFVNLTEVYINEQEAELLKKGLKHNIESYNQKRELEQTIVDTEVIISRLPTEEQEHARHICRHIIEKDINAKKTRKQKNENQTIKGLKEKLRANDVITTKADKGNSTVLIDKKDYIEKTESLITEIGCNKLGKDPTEEYQAAINAIKKSTTIIKDNLPYRLTLMNPSVPPLIALPKTHKPGTPMRPIINYKSAPGYRLSKHLKTLLKDSLDLRNKYTITNTTELIEKMKSLKINENTKFVSFDIKDLYPSIPTIETIKTVQEILMGKMKREAVTEIINALKVTLKQNYFRFNNKIYKQINGLGMGNPTSAILMEVFMQTLEEKYMKNLSTNLGVKFYARYVDDVICLIEGNKEKQILDYLNKQHQNIKFTMETEEERKINYLDLTVKINDTTNKIEFEIYRKPTATDTIIHNSSNHPQQNKNAAFKQLITRLERTPLTEECYKKELDTIYAIAENNGYRRGL